MFGNPSSTGINQGAAQVFDTSGIVNAYIRTAMQERQSRQQEEQATAKMLSQFDSSKLRATDIPKFNQLYGKLRELYISNKGLYRNPMQHPQAYSQASQMVNELRTLAAESKTYEDFGSKVATEAIKNRNSLAPNFLEKFQVWNNLSTDEIKGMNGGRMPDFTDVQYVPEEPSPEETKKLVFGAANSLDAVRTNRTFLTHKEDPTIPEFDQVRIDETTIDPGAMPAIANLMLSRPQRQQYYEYKYDELPQDQKSAMRLDLVQKYPELANSMTGPQMLATSELLQQNRVIDRKEVVGSNTAALRADADRDRQASQNFQRSERIARQNHSASMVGQSSSHLENVENMNLEQTKEFLGKIVEIGKSPNTTATLNLIDQAVAPLAYLSAGLKKGVRVLQPNRYKNAESFAAVVDALLDDPDSDDPKKTAAEVFAVDKARAMEMWKSNTPLVTFELVDDDASGAKGKVYMIDPTRKNVDAALQPIMNAFGSKARGFAQGFPGYKQPTKKVKK